MGFDVEKALAELDMQYMDNEDQPFGVTAARLRRVLCAGRTDAPDADEPADEGKTLYDMVRE